MIALESLLRLSNTRHPNQPLPEWKGAASSRPLRALMALNRVMKKPVIGPAGHLSGKDRTSRCPTRKVPHHRIANRACCDVNSKAMASESRGWWGKLPTMTRTDHSGGGAEHGRPLSHARHSTPTSPSIRQERTLRWFTASTTNGKRSLQSLPAAGDQPDTHGIPPGHQTVAARPGGQPPTRQAAARPPALRQAAPSSRRRRCRLPRRARTRSCAIPKACGGCLDRRP
jgi:hypothetical protein